MDIVYIGAILALALAACALAAGCARLAGEWWKGLLHIGVFIAKLVTLMVVFIWTRWMLPRFRYDQLMDLGWRRFIPLALANILLTAVVLWIRS